MTALELKVYDIFKVKLGEKEAEAVMELIQVKASQAVEEAKDLFITAKDKETLLTVAAAKELFASKADLAKMEGNLQKELAASKTDLMKWMIGLFIPLYLSIIGLFVTILLKN